MYLYPEYKYIIVTNIIWHILILKNKNNIYLWKTDDKTCNNHWHKENSIILWIIGYNITNTIVTVVLGHYLLYTVS